MTKKFRATGAVGTINGGQPRQAKGDAKTVSALVDVIIARPGTPFTEDDRDFLEQGDVDRLTAIAAWEPHQSAPQPPDLTEAIKAQARRRAAQKKGR